jgi:hypothetical protein
MRYFQVIVSRGLGSRFFVQEANETEPKLALHQLTWKDIGAPGGYSTLAFLDDQALIPDDATVFL